MLRWATIRLGIGPHSSSYIFCSKVTEYKQQRQAVAELDGQGSKGALTAAPYRYENENNINPVNHANHTNKAETSRLSIHWLLSILFGNPSRLVLLNTLAEIPVVVVESEIWIVHFHQAAPL